MWFHLNQIGLHWLKSCYFEPFHSKIHHLDKNIPRNTLQTQIATRPHALSYSKQCFSKRNNVLFSLFITHAKDRYFQPRSSPCFLFSMGLLRATVRSIISHFFFHIRTVHLDIIKVLFIHHLIHKWVVLKNNIVNNCNFSKHKLIRSLMMV